jgi:2-phospho-L-lactate/phosphoenolpyruvate guanylyltransferase
MPHPAPSARFGRIVAMSDSVPPAAPDRYAVLVPVKPPAFAKSRLAGLGDAVRVELATAFAADTVAAALACPLVARLLVVTDDHLLARGMRDLGADVLPDGTTDDLNGTLLQGAAELHRREPGLGLVALCADLPALRPAELEAALTAADPARMSFVADEERVGTTAVIASRLEQFRPSFGDGSRLQHLEAGAFEVDALDAPGLRRDVDEPGDLEAAVLLGVGPRTSLVVTTTPLG